MLLGLTQLAGVPVKVSPHRSLNTSRSRDIASCSVEEIVDELHPQGVTAAVIIHVKDVDSKRRTNTVILTFASPQPPKHITAGYIRVPVDPYIPNPLRCFNCQKYGHSSRACKNPAACVKCGKTGHEGASCSNQELYSTSASLTITSSPAVSGYHRRRHQSRRRSRTVHSVASISRRSVKTSCSHGCTDHSSQMPTSTPICSMPR